MSKIKGIVIPIWIFAKAGGVRVLSKLANAFTEKGIKTLLVSYYKSETPYFPVDCEIRYADDNGCFVSREEPSVSKNTLEVLHLRRKMIKALTIALNNLSDEYNVVIANHHLTAYAVNKCHIRHKFYYIQAYEAWFNGGFAPYYNHVARKSYQFDLIKIVNADLYKSYEEIRSEYVVPPGLDLKTYCPKKAEMYWDHKRPFIIGHIGRTEVWKGSKDVADAVKILQDEGLGIKYVVAFNSPVEGICSCELVKPDGDSNLADYYRSVDVLVAPGHIQLGAIHYPVIEAMACGTPVITTGYYPASDENAYLVSVKSPKEIAETIKSIINDYSLAMKKVENANKVIEEFSWYNVSEKMINIIENNIMKVDS